MKNILSLLLLSFVFNIVSAQSPPTPPSPPNSSSSKTEKHVSISIDKDLKLRLKIDNEHFNLKITYPKKFMNNFQNKFIKNFSALKGTNTWNGTDKTTRIKIHRNKIEVSFLKAKISEVEKNKIKTFAEEILEQLEWDVEEMELWEYSGDWSLSNSHEQQ